MFCKDDQGSLLGCQLCDESRVERKGPDVSFISSVEENRTFAFIPVLIWQWGKKAKHRELFIHSFMYFCDVFKLKMGFTCDQITLVKRCIHKTVEVEVVEGLTEIFLCECWIRLGTMRVRLQQQKQSNVICWVCVSTE